MTRPPTKHKSQEEPRTEALIKENNEMEIDLERAKGTIAAQQLKLIEAWGTAKNAQEELERTKKENQELEATVEIVTKFLKNKCWACTHAREDGPKNGFYVSCFKAFNREFNIRGYMVNCEGWTFNREKAESSYNAHWKANAPEA
jgi:hypothetical protein